MQSLTKTFFVSMSAVTLRSGIAILFFEVQFDIELHWCEAKHLSAGCPVLLLRWSEALHLLLDHNYRRAGFNLGPQIHR